MAYAKRYAGGFVDKPTLTTPIDSAFLNAVETALLELLSTDGSVDGQVMQWIQANSKFGPALLLNKNVDPAAAIDKSKLNLAGQIANADISGAAAIDRSKLNFAAGLVNADISAVAAIASTKVAVAQVIANVTVSATPTDLGSIFPNGSVSYVTIGTGGGTIRSINGATDGTRVTMQNRSGANITLKHLLAGGAGDQILCITGADTVISGTTNGTFELVHIPGNFWLQVR